jgi:hypothetical protein
VSEFRIGDIVEVDLGAGGVREGTIIRISERKNGVWYGLSVRKWSPIVWRTAAHMISTGRRL